MSNTLLKLYLTFPILEPLLGTAELALGPLEALLQGIDLRSQCGRGQQRSLHSHIDMLMLDSCVYLFYILSPAFLSEHQIEHQGLLSMP